MKQQKLLYVAEVRLPGRKASSIHVMRMCKAFVDQGIKIRLLAFRSPDFKNEKDLFDYYGIDKDFEVRLIDAPGTGRLAAFFLAIVALIQVIKYKPVIAYTRSVISAYIMSFISRNVVFEAHTFVYESKHNWATDMFKRLIRKKSFLGLTVISEALKQMYVEKGMNPDDIFVAHDGADEKPLKPAGELEGGYSFNVGYFGSVYSGRGVDLILQMAGRLPGVGFHIFGGQAREIERKEGISDNVFFYGFVPPASVHLFRNSCDILLAPYQPDVFVSEKRAFSTSSYMSPLKIFEYMSACKAIIVSDMPVLGEVLSADKAMMVPPKDVEAWIEALELLKEDDEKRMRLAKNAYNHFVEYYTWHKRAASIYEWLVSRLKRSS